MKIRGFLHASSLETSEVLRRVETQKHTHSRSLSLSALIRTPTPLVRQCVTGSVLNNIPQSRWLCSSSMETSHSNPPTLCQQLRGGGHAYTPTLSLSASDVFKGPPPFLFNLTCNLCVSSVHSFCSHVFYCLGRRRLGA